VAQVSFCSEVRPLTDFQRVLLSFCICRLLHVLSAGQKDGGEKLPTQKRAVKTAQFPLTRSVQIIFASSVTYVTARCNCLTGLKNSLSIQSARWIFVRWNDSY